MYIVCLFQVAETLFRSYGEFPVFTGGWRPHIRVLFQAQAGTRVEPLTFRELDA